MTISNPADRKRIRDALQEISSSLTRISAERDLIKNIKGDLHEEFKQTITRKQINKMARVYHKQSFDDELAEASEFEVLYEDVVLAKSGTPTDTAQ